MVTEERSGDAGGPGEGSIPDVHRYLSSASQAELADQLRRRRLPVPADLLARLSSGNQDADDLPFVHEFLSAASRAHVAADLRSGGHSVPSGLLPAYRDADIPYVHDLLSQASLAYVAEGLGADGRAIPSELRLAIAKAKPVDARIRSEVRARLRNQTPPGEGSGTRMPERIGPYQLLRRLGKGGMGTVYACRRDGVPVTLAIKVINAGRLAEQEERLRFKQEIAVLLRLRHENICRLRDFGQEGASYWFVMDYIDGRDLSEWRQADAPPQSSIAATMATVCRAVAHAHRQGIVHRDITPANIMLLADGRPVVMDFGLARDLDAGPSMTVTGMTVGTPPFMAPEQTRGKAGSITRATDVWGAGATLYYLATGQPPHQGDNTFEVFKAINERMVRRPRDLRPDIDPSLEMVILRCLQPEPGDRYGDLDSLARDLEEVAAGRRVRVRLPGMVTTLARQVRRRPLPWLLACALVGTGLGFLGYVASQQIREWGSWTTVMAYGAGAELPAGLQALDRNFLPQPMPTAGDDGIPRFGSPEEGTLGWWWTESSGMDGDVRVEAEFSLVQADGLEFAIGASREPMRDWWHHPAGWGVKIETKDILGVSVRYQDRPGPITRSQMRLLPGLAMDRIQVRIDRRDTELRISVNGSEILVFDDPLAVGGAGRGLGVRYFQPGTRMQGLRIERLALAERIPPVATGDTLVRRGRLADAVSEYRTVAADHRSPEIAGPALLRALAATCRQDPSDEDAQRSIIEEIRTLAEPGLMDQAQRIRAIWLWSQGRHAQAVGIAQDLVARAPERNPFAAFMADRSRDLSSPLGPHLLRLAAQAPPLGRMSLARSGLQDLELLPRRSILELSIDGNAIRDLRPVRGLGLRIIEAADNLIDDLAPLAQEPYLTNLSLPHNRISDLAPLASIPNLQRVDLGFNPITKLVSIPPTLSSLSLNGTSISDLSPISGSDLKFLNIADTHVRDLGPLRGAGHLTRVNISGTAVRDLSPLSALRLTLLHASRTRLDLGSVRMADLQDLVIENGGIRDVSDLAGLMAPSLRQVSLAHNPLKSFPALDAPVLYSLRLTGCELAGPPDISTLPALTRLYLDGNQLTDIAGMGTSRLTTLDLRNNRITDLEPLLASPPPDTLVRGNPLTGAACERLMQRGLDIGRLDLYWQGVSMLIGPRPDPVRWRTHAIPVGEHRYAVAYTGPISASSARLFAQACGAELALPLAPDVAEFTERSVVSLETFWIGAEWRGQRLWADDGSPIPMPLDLSQFPYRQLGILPAVDLPVSISKSRRWCLRTTDTAEGVVMRFPTVLRQPK